MKINIPNKGVKNIYAKKIYGWTLISIYVFKLILKVQGVPIKMSDQ